MIAAIQPTCLHCPGPLTHGGGRGLCNECHRDWRIRDLYPKRKPGRKPGYTTPDGRPAVRLGKWENEPDPRPERQPGDPPHRCLWCASWRCEYPLAKCDACEREYHRMVAAAGPLPRDKE